MGGKGDLICNCQLSFRGTLNSDIVKWSVTSEVTFRLLPSFASRTPSIACILGGKLEEIKLSSV